MMNRRSASVLWPILLMGCLSPVEAVERFRRPAPAEDAESVIQTPVFGRCAGHEDTDASLSPMEWVAKRTWHVLGLPWNRRDFEGPPAMSVSSRDGWVEVVGTVVDGGVPLRNQVITCLVEQIDGPVLVLLRSTDAFGEVLIELDLAGGRAIARSVTVSRTMIGGQSHSSPMPEESSSRVVATAEFPPQAGGPVELRIFTRGADIEIAADGRGLLAFDDPDPAGGKFGFGSAGRMRLRDVQQWELISPREQQRRQECLRELYAFAHDVDSHFEDDVRRRNDVVAEDGRVRWTWPATGATAVFRPDGPAVMAEIRAGLYGDDLLAAGRCPAVAVLSAGGEFFGPDPARTAVVESDDLNVRMLLPLKSAAGRTAVARVTAARSCQTVWFWTVTVEGPTAKVIRAEIDLAEGFRVGSETAVQSVEPLGDLPVLKSRDLLRHNNKAGFYVKASEPPGAVLYRADGGGIGVACAGSVLKFATSILPAQPLNLTGFKHRMVHFIRYPEGPVQHWRRLPSFQEYPDNVDLARYAGHGTDAMVWHHTWINSDFRDREGFLVNHAEMKRAMEESHRLGMKTIGYLGILPGRSALLRFEDLCPGKGRYGGYQKNWDLQDQTFYHITGRYPRFLAWMADYWCREYGLDGFYLDGGCLGTFHRGPTPPEPGDEGLTLDEIAHRAYYRVRKVLELNRAGYGLEPWSGLDWLLNGFYDCMMIGESFQEAEPEYYRDGHNALLTGCMIKMYGMRESSQNPYNIAMAAINLSDIQVCSGNGAWGDDPDTTDTWNRVRPLWDLLDSIDWDRVIQARPWYAQELVGGEGFYTGYYMLPDRVLVFLANRTEDPATFDVAIDTGRLPTGVQAWQARYCLGRSGDIGPLGSGRLRVDLPALHQGPIGIELTPAR